MPPARAPRVEDQTAACGASLRQRLIQAGQNNCRQFSWEKCAQETLTIYYE